MKRSLFLFLQACVLLGGLGLAEVGCRQVGGSIISWEEKDSAVWIKTTEGILYLQPYESGSLHVMFGAMNELTKPDKYAVAIRPSVAPFHIEETADDLKLMTERFEVLVDKRFGNLKLLDPSGQLLLEELPEEMHRQVINDSVHAACKFGLQAEDALYGLGEFRDGRMNLRGAQRKLVQFNTQAAVPVVYSTGGWGLFWNNPSCTLFSDDDSGMGFTSDYGKRIDYYLFVAPTLDGLISSYRSLTGNAPLLPDWALGFHQSRNRYASQQEVMDVVERMKDEGIPLSTIFVDYHYWGKYGTGSHRFDEAHFPDVTAMIDRLHKEYDVKVVLTVWPCFKPDTPNYDDLSGQGYILEGAKAIDGYIYDAFNPKAADAYWKKVSPLTKLGIDGWFLDGPEPDHVESFLEQVTYDGPAHRVRNLYPLVHASNFYEGFRETFPDIRPYFLTRCAWAAQQRLGTAVWSGDIPTTFDELALQVVAGLNFTATGIPYWTTDIGGYSGGDPGDEAYRELFTRWFQYGTFCPIFRSHGRRYPGDTRVPNELWAYGSKVQRICTDFIKLRYSLLPYIYTLSGEVTFCGYTPMRLLAFDFPDDSIAMDCKDEFMYGPSLLVCPVLQAGCTSRKVYLPVGHKWIDFWTGNVYDGGCSIDAPAPIQYIPLYVRSGSIIPCYQSVEKHVNPKAIIDINVYPGEDASFCLYEDDGTTMNYQRGEYNRIPLVWNEAGRELTIGKMNRKMDGKRKFVVRLIGEGGMNGVKEVEYKGDEVKVHF